MPASAAWSALRLTERRPWVAARDRPRLTASAHRHALAAVARWKAQAPFEQPHWFQARLHEDELSEADLLYLCGTSCDPPAATDLPAPWQERLAAAFRHRTGGPPVVSGLARVAEPLVRAAMDEVRRAALAAAAGLTHAPVDPQTVAALLWSAMANRFDWMLSRALVLELHLARRSGPLPGDTPGDRFESFLAAASETAGALRFFGEYTVLARLIVEAVDLWQEASCELVRRLCADWQAILAELHPDGDPGPLVALAGAAGDTHCRGRAVSVLVFASGFRISYRPRPVAVNVHFAELLAWLNQRGAPGLGTARVLARDGYGWIEFIAAEPCRDRAAIERFYLRQGAFLALFHVLHANDLHWENLIARGEHPYFIDLECLLGPDYGQFDPETHDSPAHFELTNSVMRVMMLPFFHANARQDVIEPSGLGGDPGQTSVFDVPAWDNPGTDEMRLAKRRGATPEVHHRPTLAGAAADPLAFQPFLEAGFVKMYRLLARHRRELRGADSPLSRLGSATIRIVLRASQLYTFLLQESYHPDLLRDAVERERHLDRLWFGIDRSRMPDVAQRILPAERRDLWRGDLPYFSARGDSLDVADGDGGCLPGLLRRSGIEMATERLAQLGRRDLDRQLWFLRAAMAALAIDREGQPPPRRVRTARTGAASGGAAVNAAGAAVDISRRLHELAFDQDGRAAWLGLAKTRSRGWWLRPLDVDLYAGLPGMALYLAFAGAVLDRPEDTRLAAHALASLDRLTDRPRRISFVGGFDGWGGVLYTWLQVGRLWRDERLLNRASAAVAHLAELVDRDDELDILRGGAGAIVPLLALHRQGASGSAEALRLAQRIGARICAAAQPFRSGVYWQTASFPAHPLTGFSHGTAGFAWALSELHAATGDAELATVAARAIAFEEEFFAPERANWMDLRSCRGSLGACNYPQDATYTVSWCHGACGIGWSRLRLWRRRRDPALLAAVRVAAHATYDDHRGNHSLCHGDLGNLLFLREAATALADAALAAKADRRETALLHSLAAHGPLCGVPFQIESPGLMEGLAGIGYGLLQLAAPDRVPCVMLLDPLPPSHPAAPSILAASPGAAA